MLQHSSLPIRNSRYPFENVQIIINGNSLLKLSAFSEFKKFFFKRNRITKCCKVPEAPRLEVHQNPFN